MEDVQPECPMDEALADSTKAHPDVDSGYGGSSNQSLKTSDGHLNQRLGLDDESAVSEACPRSLQPQRISLRPISKPIDEQTAKRATDVIEQMSGLLQEYMAKSKWRKYLPRPKKELPSMSIRAIMLGTTAEDAKVYLVIFCTDTDGTHDRIRSFLRKSFVKDLYRPVDSTIPSFDVHIFGAAPNMRTGMIVQIPTHFDATSSTVTHCGKPIYLIGTGFPVPKALATMGGIVELIEAVPPRDVYARRLYGLTVAHGVMDLDKVGNDYVTMSESVSESSSLSTDSTTSDDSHYTAPIEIDWGISTETIQIENRPATPRLQSHYHTLTQPVTYSALKNDGPFRDWVLFDFPAEMLRSKPNMLQAKGEAPVLLKAPKSLTDTHVSRSVAIITGSSGVKEATLSPCLSRILLKPGTEFVRAYSVELSDNSDIQQGDSGSWVVDASTFEVYGHLVATDMLLGSYVIPLIDIFSDIGSQSAQASIKFPSPQSSPVLSARRLVSRSGPLHRDDDGVADESDVASNPVAAHSSIFSSAMTSTGTRTSAASSSAHASSQLKGRSRLWTNSHQRKLARAYVYTTLPFEKTIAALDVYLPGWTLGIDSAHQALDSLLDKQSWWLRPRTREEMNARLQKLAESPLRKTQARRNMASALSLGTPSNHKIQELQNVLKDYSATYVEIVQKLMTSYSVKSADEADADLDDVEMAMEEFIPGSWLHDKDAPSISIPAPIPGDFLHLDRLLASQGYCGPGLSTHETRSCLCYARDETSLEDFVTEKGPTQKAPGHLVSLGGVPSVIDTFGNTALHYFAARDKPDFLIMAVNRASDLTLSALNTAHQTFLHVLGEQWFQELEIEGNMLPTLLERLKDRQFPIYARDIYGRSLFHLLQTNIRSQETIDDFLSRYDQKRSSRRDAFGVIPTRSINDQPMPLVHVPQTKEDDSRFATHTRALETIRHAVKTQFVEDSHGRNGLHLVADVIVTTNTMMQNFDFFQEEKLSKKVGDKGTSTDKLLLAKKLVQSLLEVGADVNHYDNDGNTVLMTFVAQLPEDGDCTTPCEIIQELIDGGATLDARNRFGETALHIAVRTGRKLATRTLIQAGANVHVRDGEGRSVLDVADVKILHAKDVKKFAHYEAIRAWLAGLSANAVQSPSVKQEWGRKTGK